MRRSNWIVLVIGGLCTANDMSPHDADLFPGVDVDDGGGHGGPEATVAGKIAIVHILDGVVGVGSSNAHKQALVLEDHQRRGRGVKEHEGQVCYAQHH